MRLIRSNYDRFYKDILMDENLTIHEQVYYMIVVNRAENNDGSSFQKHDKIEEHYGIDHKKSERMVASLKEKGYIHVERKKRGLQITPLVTYEET